MFVARSAARIRFARIVFLAACLAPAAGLVGWAVHLRGESHRRTIERRWQAATGIPLTVAAVEHPRPGVIRGRRCVVPAPDGGPAFELPLVEIESSADEDRIRVDGFSCDVRAAGVLIGLARAWLTDEVRFDRTCIVEVADGRWAGPPEPTNAADVKMPLRIECVARTETRALRFVRQAGEAPDEVRIVRHLAPRTEAAATPGDAMTVSADCRSPVPLAALLLAAGAAPSAAAASGAAGVRGVLEAARDDTGWRGSARGRLADIDLAGAAAAIGGRAEGTATVDVERLTWAGGRVTEARLECVAGSGAVDGRLFDRIVLALAARPGPAARPLPAGGERRFDAAACTIDVGPHGVQVLPAARLPNGLAVLAGEVLLTAPAATVPGDRMAWMLAAPGATYAPTMGPGAWLISVLPAGPSESPPAAGRRF